MSGEYGPSRSEVRRGVVGHGLRGAEFRLLAPLLFIIVLRIASEPTANASYLTLGVYALFGRAHAIRALALSWLFTMANPGLVPEASLATVGRYVVIMGAGASALVHSSALSRSPRIMPFTFLTILLGAFIVGHSVLYSPIVDVSILKAVSWTVVVVSSASCWMGLPTEERYRLIEQLFWGLVLVLAASLPLLVLPVGFLRNGVGFQGVLNQPQAFGPTMALLGAWTIARLLAESRPGWWLIGVAGASVALVLLSQARTAGLALVGGVGLAVLVAPGLSRQSFLSIAPGMRSGRVWVILGGVLVAGIAVAPTILDIMQVYLTKSRTGVEGLFELYQDTRGHLIDRMTQNVAEHPLTGIGFGIASEPELMLVERDSVLGLPTGAAIEKGLTYLAVVEELGIFGAGLVGLWLLRVVKGAGRNGLVPLTLCFAVLLMNISESTLFSPGGLGLLPLVLLTGAVAGGRVVPRNG